MSRAGEPARSRATTHSRASPRARRWTRYSLFLVLYPAGIAGEMGCLFAALNYVRDNKVLSLALPNAYNAVWNHYYFLLLCIVLYAPGSYTMVNLMWVERRKKLGAICGRAGPAEKKGE